MALVNWSTTAANNAAVDSINFAEGQAPSTLNNSARELMAQVRAGVSIRVATTAAMTALTSTKLSANDIIAVADPDRGGLFQVVSGSTTPNNGTTFSPDDAGAIHFKRIYSGPVDVKWFGDVSTPAARTAALEAALLSADAVFVSAGIYDPIEISASNKTLFMDAGVEFKLPNGTVISTDVTGPAVFHISGDNVTVHGNFTINGNRANNSSFSFPTSVRIGSLYITGDNAALTGEVYVKDAYWVGAAAEGGSTAGTEIIGPYIHRLKVDDADYHSVMLWSVTDWRIDAIIASGGTPGTWTYGTKDPRIRLGTQLSNTSKCKNGSVGYVFSDKYIALTLENGIDNVSVPVALTGAGGKIQNASNIDISCWHAWDASVKYQSYGLAVIDSDGVRIGHALVKDYDCDNAFAGYGFAITGADDLKIGSITVTGSLATAANTKDMIITSAKDVHIGQVVLTAPIGTIEGFQFDYDAAYAPQENIVIDSLISRDHATWDISVDNAGPIRIGYVNDDAVFEASSKLNVYPRILKIGDGITAPTAESSLAQIYVDGADGDLKVIFADGTVKTIVTDT